MEEYDKPKGGVFGRNKKMQRAKMRTVMWVIAMVMTIRNSSSAEGTREEICRGGKQCERAWMKERFRRGEEARDKCIGERAQT